MTLACLVPTPLLTVWISTTNLSSCKAYVVHHHQQHPALSLRLTLTPLPPYFPKQHREAQAATRLAALTQLNTQLTTEVQQAQSAAAALEIKLERMQGRLVATQQEAAAAAAAAAAAVDSDDAAAAAAAAATAAAEAVQSQLKTEIGHLKNEMAGTQAKASRAELELAVARTKVLVAQQVCVLVCARACVR